MTDKRVKLPKEGFVPTDEPTTGGTQLRDQDVEGHSFATPAPPLMPSTPSTGGEFKARGGDEFKARGGDDFKARDGDEFKARDGDED